MPKRKNETSGSSAVTKSKKKVVGSASAATAAAGTGSSGLASWLKLKPHTDMDKEGELTENFHWNFTNVKEEMRMRCGQCFVQGKHAYFCKSTHIESEDIFIGRGTGTLSKWLILLSQAHRKFSIYLHYRGLFADESGQKMADQREGFRYRSELKLTAGKEDTVLYTNEDEGIFVLDKTDLDRIQCHKGVVNLGAMFVRGSYGTFKYDNMKVSVRMTQMKKNTGSDAASAEGPAPAEPGGSDRA